jgi:hypothetical protein
MLLPLSAWVSLAYFDDYIPVGAIHNGLKFILLLRRDIELIQRLLKIIHKRFPFL